MGAPNRNASLIGAPTDIGASDRGASMGPEALRVAGIHAALTQRGLNVVDTTTLQQTFSPLLSASREHLPEELAKLKAPADKASEQKAKESRNKTLAQLAQQEQADLQKSMEADQKNNAAKLIEKAKEETAKEQVAKKVS